MSSEILLQFKESLEKNKFGGNIALDIPTRILNSTDNSIYELMPQAILQPRNISDIQIIFNIANYDAFKHLTFTPRGGGTGTNAQSLTNGIVIDTSRYMRQISNLDTNNNTVTVEAGVVLSELNSYLREHGLFFAPMISTADRATIGGMIATDAAGKGSLIYGKTSDHITNIDLVMVTGEIICTGSILDTNFTMLKNNIISLLDNDVIQDEIKNRFPELKRPLSGYNIKQCYEKALPTGEKIFNLNRLICGSEGTLGFVAQATLKLLPIPKYKTMVIVHYATFLEALNDANFLISHEVMTIEAVDEKVQTSATTLPNWPYLAGLLNLSLDEICVSNFIEFVEDDISLLNAKVENLKNSLNLRESRYVIVNDATQINQLWSIRSLAVGLATRMAGLRKPIAFIEDCIVPPEHLYEFVKDLQELFAKKQLNYAMYGHVDVGCIHVRPALNMQSELDRVQIRPITDEIIKLTNKYHGLLWGEHGKGVRGEFVVDVFGDVLYPVLQKIKALFDPMNRLNPNKLVTPFQHTTAELFRIDKVTMRGELDRIIEIDVQNEYASAMLCNGNGACFNRDLSNVMCPSYKVTNDRIHSPKGRAMLVKEWLRSMASNSNRVEQKQSADMALNALAGCLGCKGCSGKCPSQVSIPDLRTKFLNDYYFVHKYKRRSLRDYLLAHAENLLLIAAKTPRLWNFINKFKIIPSFALQDLPSFPLKIKLTTQLKRRKIPLYTSSTKLGGDKPMVIIVDVFSGLFNPDILFQSIDVFKKIGYTPYVLYPETSGKALIVAGMIDKFTIIATKMSSIVNPLFARGILVVGLENSVTIMYRDEYPKFAKPLKGKILTLAEALVLELPNIANVDTLNISHEYSLLPHCTEQAILPSESANWVKIFNQLGFKLKVQNLGCCGMAGLYGHQKENLANSYELYDNNWKPNMKSTDAQYLATGFSCRSQASRIDNIELQHPIHIVWKYTH